MKIAIDCGHNCPPDIGCAGLSPKYPTEDVLTRQVSDLLIQKLKGEHQVYDVTPRSAYSVANSLRRRVQAANIWGADLYLSIHFNCFNRKAFGSETYAISESGRRYAYPIVENLAALGFKNRGMKKGDKFYVLKYTNMPAVLIEVCFCDSEEDMRIFDAEKVAAAIAEAI